MIVKTESKQIVISKTGVKGDKGDPGGAAQIFNFAWGDATPQKLTTLNTGQRLLSATVAITTPFNVMGLLSVGTLANPGQFIAVNESNVMAANQYELSPMFTALSATDIYLFIQPAFGTVQGSGFIYLEIS